MIQVRSWDATFRDDGRDGTLPGYAHRSLVDRSAGAVHTDLGLCRLSAGSRTPRHVHSYEQCAYVLEGSPEIEIGESRYALETGDYVLFPVGTPHAWRVEEGPDALWLELGSPLVDGRRQDTVAVPGTDRAGPAKRPAFGDPTVRFVGHYAGTDSQSETLALADPARGRAPAGMDTALLAYSGISVKMMVDPGLGADLLTMFMVDYEPGGAAQVHDHPFEEAYFFLQGEIEGEVEGEVRTFRAGEVLFCGVGVLHGFFNTSGGHVRWIETQAPQPPRRHSYRWPANWSRLAEQNGHT
ncbi:MAG: cupin domain-containing protein [Acidimicrobiales bacterium]